MFEEFISHVRDMCSVKVGDLSKHKKDVMEKLDSQRKQLEELKIAREKVVDYETALDGVEAKIEEVEKEIKTNEGRLQSLKERIDEFRQSRAELEETVKNFRALKDRHEGNLATQKGVCPFPNRCDYRDTCTKNRCHFDECHNGHPMRRS